jgi:hypothetical protein
VSKRGQNENYLVLCPDLHMQNRPPIPPPPGLRESYSIYSKKDDAQERRRGICAYCFFSPSHATCWLREKGGLAMARMSVKHLGLEAFWFGSVGLCTSAFFSRIRGGEGGSGGGGEKKRYREQPCRKGLVGPV